MGKYSVGQIVNYGKKCFYVQDLDTCLMVQGPTAYLKWKSEERRSPNTIRRIAFSLVYYLDFLYEKGISEKEVLEMGYEDQKIHFSSYLSRLKNGNHSSQLKLPTNATCNAYLAAVFGYYHYLSMLPKSSGLALKVLEEGEISFTTEKGVKFHRKTLHYRGFLPNERPQYREVTEDEIIRIFKACRSRRDILLLDMLLDTGMRIGELLGVYFSSDIDYEKGIVRVNAREKNENGARSKYAECRDAYLSEETLKQLHLYIAENADLLKKTNYLFINLHGKNAGKAMNVDAVYSLFRQLGKRTGIKITPHKFRHFYANERRKAGVDLLVIKDLLGHKRIDTTLSYLHLTDLEREKAEEEFKKNYGKIYMEDTDFFESE